MTNILIIFFANALDFFFLLILLVVYSNTSKMQLRLFNIIDIRSISFWIKNKIEWVNGCNYIRNTKRCSIQNIEDQISTNFNASLTKLPKVLSNIFLPECYVNFIYWLICDPCNLKTIFILDSRKNKGDNHHKTIYIIYSLYHCKLNIWYFKV